MINYNEYLCIDFRGVLLKDRAEIIPFEPDVDNPTVGKKKALLVLLLVSFSFIQPLFIVKLKIINMSTRLNRILAGNKNISWLTNHCTMLVLI